jgi:predicted RNase H-like HicB family nuclease/uncharacterized protein (DUF1778 family)
VSFPDFPGCIALGNTLDESQQMAAEASALHIKGMIEDGEPIPEPSPLDALVRDPARQGSVAVLVKADLPDCAVRINITAREKQIEQIDRLASEAGMTRSAFMVNSALQGAKPDIVRQGAHFAAKRRKSRVKARAAKKGVSTRRNRA